MSVYSSEMFVFLDETGADRINTLRKYGYSLRGKPMRSYNVLMRGERIPGIACISMAGLLDIMIVHGTTDGSTFYKFIQTHLLPHLMPFNGSNPHSVVVMDNCAIHHVDSIVKSINDENLIPIDIQPIDNKKDKVIVKDLITPGYIKTLLLGNNKTACILFRFNKEIKDFKYAEPDLDKRIKLSTIHASKGLQYDIVHVPNYIFFRNAANNIESDDKFNEHMNLCYVALSRAKETLLLD